MNRVIQIYIKTSELPVQAQAPTGRYASVWFKGQLMRYLQRMNSWDSSAINNCRKNRGRFSFSSQ